MSSFAPPVRSSRRVMTATLAAATAFALVASAAPSGAATKAAAKKFTIGVRAVDVGAGSLANVPITLSSPKTSAYKWSIEGLPVGVSASVSCPAPRACALSLIAMEGAGEGAALVTVTLKVGSTRQQASFALAVHGRAVSALPPAPTPTTPTAPPVATPAPVAAHTFSLRPDAVLLTAAPGTGVNFSIGVARDAWTGPVAMKVDTLPAGWGAAFLPANPVTTTSTGLLLAIPSGTASGDYGIRLSGRSDTSGAETNIVVRVQVPQPTVTILSSTTGTPGGTAQFVLDARSLDDPTKPVTLGIENLLNVTASFSANPTVGTVTAALAVGTTVSPGNYAFNFVASRNGVVARFPAVLSVVPATAATNTVSFSFATTAVTPVPGDAAGYTLAASPGAASMTRGTSVSYDITVGPRGGFTDPVAVSVTAPTGWTVSAAPVAANVFRLTFAVPSDATVASSTLTVLTTSGLLSASIGLGVTVV